MFRFLLVPWLAFAAAGPPATTILTVIPPGDSAPNATVTFTGFVMVPGGGATPTGMVTLSELNIPLGQGKLDPTAHF